MRLGHLTERLMAMDDRTWARHANPLSGWSRMTILPLFALALWFRETLGQWTWAALALLALWTWLNPRIFPEPDTLDSWISRGVLGERIWLARDTHPIPAHHARAALLLTTAAALGLPLLAAGLWRFDPGLTLAGLVITMGAKLWFLDRMAWLHADSLRDADGRRHGAPRAPGEARRSK